jgi:type IV secretory pathway VirB10-like protein
MSSHHKLNPPAYAFHPEFGYLCPSPQVRQNVRVGLAAAAFGVIIGVIGALALFPRHGGNLPRTQPALAVAPSGGVTDSARSAASTPSIAPPGAPSGMGGRVVSVDGGAKQPPPAVPTSPAVEATKVIGAESPSAADKRCTEETWPYFDSKCLWGPARKDANEAPSSVQTPTRATSAVAGDRGAATAKRSEQRRAAASKKTRTANSSKRRRATEPDPRAAFATSPFGFQASPFSDGARSGRRRDWGGWSW